MNKTEFQTLRQLIDGTEQIKVVDVCDNFSTLWEGTASDAPAKNWEVFGIYTKDDVLTIAVN